MSQWYFSMLPFTCKLYAEILIPLILYFHFNQSKAAANWEVLSKMNNTTTPYLHMISSKIHLAVILVLSDLTMWASTQLVNVSESSHSH